MEDEPPGQNQRIQAEAILRIISEAEPEGIGRDELRKAAEAMKIDALELDQALQSLMMYANIYFNASKGKYHYMWSSSIQYE